MNPRHDRIPVHAVFVSDIHLGTRGAKAEELLTFLARYEFDILYIVGDLIDLWQMSARKMNWRRAHTKVIERILAISKEKQVYYIIGNHDEEFRNFVPLNMYNLHFTHEHVHHSIKGDELFIFHGDIVDVFMHRNYRIVSSIGGRFYDLLLGISWLYNKVRIFLNKPYWSLSHYLKTRTKNIGNIIEKFEKNIYLYARKHGYKHVLCGHVHYPEIKDINGIRYMNTGDWVENCSAVIEDLNGDFSIVHEPVQMIKRGGRPKKTNRPARKSTTATAETHSTKFTGKY